MSDNQRLTLASLAEQIGALEAKLQWMERVLQVQGIKGPWMSPAKAAAIIGVSRDRIMDEIEAAERLRAIGKKGDLAYGVHYRNIQNVHNPGIESSTWQVHFSEFERILNIPPDRRKVG